MLHHVLLPCLKIILGSGGHTVLHVNDLDGGKVAGFTVSVQHLRAGDVFRSLLVRREFFGRCGSKFVEPGPYKQLLHGNILPVRIILC